MAFKVATKSNSSRRRRSVSAEINVTPLVDVMLVLLVIFMATAPMLSAGVPVDIPDSQAGAIHEDDQGPIEVTLTATGQIYVGETPVTQDRLIELLGAMTKDNPDRRIFLRADKKLDYGTVMGTLGAMNAAGYGKIALITQQGVTAPGSK
jgi:biopolymer transport protein TolR